MATSIPGTVLGRERTSVLGVLGTAGLVALSALAVVSGTWKVLAIAWVAFAAMAGGTAVGTRTEAVRAERLVWGYGLSSGAMLTSAAVFLLPQAIGLDPRFGGFGVAAGVVVGYGTHTIGHRLAHRDLPLDTTTAQLTAHALAAGLVIGVVYAGMPDLGLLLGLAIVSHKGPAGYAAARRLGHVGRPSSAVLLPAAGVGLTAIPMAALRLPEAPAVNAVVFGFAAGIFLHLAMDFLPECEVGGEVGEVAGLSGEDHALLDRLRTHAVASTTLGAVAVFVAWLAIGA